MSKRERSPGHWEIKIYIGQADGEEQYEYFTFIGTRREADDEEARLRMKYGRGAIARPRAMTVGEWMDVWLADYVKAVRAPKTYENYELYVRTRIKPALGSILLRKLTAGQIQRMYIDMLDQRLDRLKGKKPLSASTVQGCHRVLRAALQRAVMLGYIPSNPAVHTAPPEAEQYEPVVLSDDEVERFLAAAKGHRLYALFEMALLTGLRVGELLALTWADIDWTARTATVTKALKDVHKRPLFVASTKSKAGKRVVLLADRTIETLQVHRRAQAAETILLGPGYENHDLVFCTGRGTFLDPKNTTRRTVKRLCARAGLDPMRFHGFRHTHGTMLEADNTDPRTLADRLGHADPAFAVRRYTRVTVAMQRAPVAKLNKRFPGGKNQDSSPEQTPENGPKTQGL